MLTIGQLAPDFPPEGGLPDQDGKVHKLSDYRGKWVLLYFYPKDDTPGCTAEACALRDNLPRFKDIDAVVLGVSTDSVASHRRFADKYGLPFTLLSDERKEVVDLYGVQGPVFTNRTSFLINPTGNIAKIYEKVKPEVHAEQVLSDLRDFRP